MDLCKEKLVLVTSTLHVTDKPSTKPKSWWNYIITGLFWQIKTSLGFCVISKKNMCLENTVSNLFVGLKLVDLFGPKSIWAQHPLGYPLSMKVPKFLTMCLALFWGLSGFWTRRSSVLLLILQGPFHPHPIHFNKRTLFHRLVFFFFFCSYPLWPFNMSWGLGLPHMEDPHLHQKHCPDYIGGSAVWTTFLHSFQSILSQILK